MNCGCVIFLDIDRYLSRIRRLGSDEELAFSRSIRDCVAEAANHADFQLVRSFGDGFLLSKTAPITPGLQAAAIRLIVETRESLKGLSLTFKAVIVGGTFVTDRLSLNNGASEVAVCGPAANYAGKRIASLERQQLFLSWPVENAETTFAAMEVLERNVATAEIAKAEQLVDFLRPGKVDFEGGLRAAKYGNGLSFAFGSTAKQYVFEAIKLADDKAKAVLAISTALLTYLFNSGIWPHEGAWPQAYAAHFRLGLLALALASLFASAFAAFMVLLPRTAESSRGLFFFGSISQWKSGDDYSNAVGGASSTKLEQQLARHNFDISKVAAQKYKALRAAVILMGLGIVLSVLYFGLNWSISNDLFGK